jgi:hypothetical protein
MRTLVPLFAVFLAATPALADENTDLDLIPGAVTEDGPAPSAPASAPPNRNYTLSLTEAASASAFRHRLLVPVPGPGAAHWENRLSIDGRTTVGLTDGLRATVSDRLSFTGDDRRGFPERRNFRNDLREAYITAEPLTRFYLEAGRINVKNGVASGYNPTDFFRTGTAVDQSSSDPSALRENRLGTAMVRGQAVWDGVSASLLYAPRLIHRPEPGAPTPTLDPQFDKTNTTNRWLATLDVEIAKVATQFLIHQDGDRTRFGLNASATLTNSVIGYIEWAGGRGLDLADAAFADGRASGLFPPGMPQLLGAGGGARFQNDLAIGASWTSEHKVTVNAEYHFHQAGLTGRQWDNWFDAGTTGDRAAAQMWQVRSYASFRQEPAARHRLFLRAAWTDAVIPRLELSAFSLVDLGDGSATAQVQASYPLSDAWSVSALASANLGRRRSEFGSVPEAGRGIVQLVRYF